MKRIPSRKSFPTPSAGKVQIFFVKQHFIPIFYCFYSISVYTGGEYPLPAVPYGAVPVSTGVWRLDKRAAAPDRHKTGKLNLTDNTNTVAVAA